MKSRDIKRIQEDPRKGADILEELTSEGFLVRPWAKNVLLGNGAFAQPRDSVTEVQLVGLPLRGNFVRPPTSKEVMEFGLDRGLLLCLATDGPSLRLQYNEQELGEWLVMAMEPIQASPAPFPCRFVVGHGDPPEDRSGACRGKWLGGGAPSIGLKRWELGNTEFVFRQPL